MWTERCLPMAPSAGSGSSWAISEATIFFWLGMMMPKTFTAMIVPMKAPTWMSAPRPEKTWL